MYASMPAPMPAPINVPTGRPMDMPITTPMPESMPSVGSIDGASTNKTLLESIQKQLEQLKNESQIQMQQNIESQENMRRLYSNMLTQQKNDITRLKEDYMTNINTLQKQMSDQNSQIQSQLSNSGDNSDLVTRLQQQQREQENHFRKQMENNKKDLQLQLKKQQELFDKQKRTMKDSYEQHIKQEQQRIDRQEKEIENLTESISMDSELEKEFRHMKDELEKSKKELEKSKKESEENERKFNESQMEHSKIMKQTKQEIDKINNHLDRTLGTDYSNTTKNMGLEPVRDSDGSLDYANSDDDNKEWSMDTDPITGEEDGADKKNDKLIN